MYSSSDCTLYRKNEVINAKELIKTYSSSGDLILDPFCGSGAIALESIIGGREIICSDVNPYAIIVTQAKLMVPSNLKIALSNAN